MHRLSSRASVIGLLFVCRPSTIGRFVIAVIVHSFKSMRCAWPSAHIYAEVPKISPPATHGNSSTAITMVTFMMFVCASGYHPSPNLIFGSPFGFEPPATTSAMNDSCSATSQEFLKKASTTTRTSRPKIGACYFSRIPAFANAFPENMLSGMDTAADSWTSRNYRKLSIGEPSEISKGWHINNYTLRNI